MSILDGPSKDAMDMANRLFDPVVSTAIATLRLTPLQKRGLEALKKGIPLGAVLKITPEQRDAMLIRGSDLLRAGHFDAARGVLIAAFATHPYDARIIYALALTYQLSGEIEKAAKLFLVFVALEALNPEGHLRLGECLLNAREYDKAREFFFVASRLGAKGRGSAKSREHAARMLAYVDALPDAKP
jgi:tetratricopeptide (TPR) repeat protein